MSLDAAQILAPVPTGLFPAAAQSPAGDAPEGGEFAALLESLAAALRETGAPAQRPTPFQGSALQAAGGVVPDAIPFTRPEDTPWRPESGVVGTTGPLIRVEAGTAFPGEPEDGPVPEAAEASPEGPPLAWMAPFAATPTPTPRVPDGASSAAGDQENVAWAPIPSGPDRQVPEAAAPGKPPVVRPEAGIAAAPAGEPGAFLVPEDSPPVALEAGPPGPPPREPPRRLPAASTAPAAAVAALASTPGLLSVVGEITPAPGVLPVAVGITPAPGDPPAGPDLAQTAGEALPADPLRLSLLAAEANAPRPDARAAEGRRQELTGGHSGQVTLRPDDAQAGQVVAPPQASGDRESPGGELSGRGSTAQPVSAPEAEDSSSIPASPEAAAPSSAAAPTAPAEFRGVAAASEPPPPPPRAGVETVAALAAQMARRLDDGTTRFDLELNPGDLGRVDVRLEIDATGGIRAAFTFETAHAAGELGRRADELQKSLENAGFNLSGGISFDVAGDRSQGRSQAWAEARDDRGGSPPAPEREPGREGLSEIADALKGRRLSAHAGVDIRI